MSTEKSNKVLISDFPLDDATPCTRQVVFEDSITRADIKNAPTNWCNLSLEQLPESAFANFGIEPVIANYKLVCPLHYSPRTGVFYAKDLASGREVVVKRFSNVNQFELEKAIQEILKSHGGHKNLLLADEVLDEKNVLISPYLRGGDLREVLKRNGIITPHQAKAIVSDLCDALQYMHECGVVHQDVKSRNMGLDITDPVLKKITAEELESSRKINLKLFDYEIGWHKTIDHLVNPEVLVGSWQYMAPELINGGKSDPRSDIYAVGVALYEMLTGGKYPYPFTGENELQVLEQHLSAPIPDVTEYNASVSADLKAVIERALAKDPEERYQSASELKNAYLEAVR